MMHNVCVAIRYEPVLKPARESRKDLGKLIRRLNPYEKDFAAPKLIINSY